MSTIRPHAATARTTMRAVVHDAYGSADVLHVVEIDRPQAADDEVLLAVHAAGLDRGTWHLMTGKPYLLRLAFGMRRPRNPVIGLDVAGTVVAVGSAVDRFAVGDEVFGFGRGTVAEYAVAKADQLAHKPPNVSFEAAAVVPVSASTALQALVDIGRMQPGNKVLVIGASGGVGSYAVQLAKALGAEVTGVASTRKQDLVRSLGADHTLDYTTDDFADGRQHYDLILDIGGTARLSRLRAALTATGTAVLVGGEEGDIWTGGMGRVLRARTLSVFAHHRLTNFIARQRSSDLDTLTELIATGAVTPTIDRSLPLAEAPAAMRLLEAGRVRGKVAIRVAIRV
jgi:NADPH:quinone reductase-like Zn-dependent oxidoreductase